MYISCILDLKIYRSCYSGPNNAEFATVNGSVTNITKLTKGDYVFKLTVVDDDGNADSDTVNVKVTQSKYCLPIVLLYYAMLYYNKFYFLDKNAPPKANAGGDQVVTAPISALIINGSQSSDDLRIGQWLWTRDQSSLAIGTIVQNTDKSPVLMVKLKCRFHLIVYTMCICTNIYVYVVLFYS